MSKQGQGEYPWRYRFLGVDLRHVGPVRDAYLSLGHGTRLHVLYGRKGAGKTSILQALMTGSVPLVVSSSNLTEGCEHQSRGRDTMEDTSWLTCSTTGAPTCGR
jgi:putative ribosome biogenesis GTPase RsgA